MINALIPIAEGVEEMEAVVLIDTFRRAEWNVMAVGLHEDTLTASRGVRLVPDANWDSIDPESFDLIALPGGLGGMECLRGDERIIETIRHFHRDNKWIAAICAAPLVLDRAGILENRHITSHPSVKDQFNHVVYEEDRVVRDGRIFTSRGPGTSLEFALAIIAAVDSPDKASAIGKAMLVH